MRNGDADSAVRILPADGSAPVDAAVPAEPKPRNWLVPLLVVAGVLGIFFISTRPATSESEGTTIPPAPIAAIDAETVDLRVEPGTTATGEWSSIDLDADGTISDVVRTGASFVAVGSTEVWISGAGSNWRRAGSVETPEDVPWIIEHVELWNNDLVALGYADGGTALWTSTYVSNWTYHGRLDVFGSGHVDQLVAGPFLLATSRAADGQSHGYRSDDGLNWEPLGVVFPADAEIVRIAGDEEWFYAFGTEGCEGCPGLIARSRNGIDWETTDIQFGDTGGIVLDIATASTQAVAIGWDYEDRGAATVWTSPEGSEWTRIAAAEPLLRTTYTTLALVAARGGDNPWVEIGIDGTVIEGTVGTSIATDSGTITVSRVTEDAVTFNDAVTLQIGEVTALEAQPLLRSVHAEGPRILIVGEIRWMNEASLAVWSSLDGGRTWSRELLGDSERFWPIAATASANILVFGTGEIGPVVWRSNWNTEQIAAASEGLVVEYLETLNNRDTAALVELLPPIDEGILEPEFAVPSLGLPPMQWWAGTGNLDSDAVAATVDYLEGTNTTIRVTECASGVWLGDPDRINVRCGYEVESELLSNLGVDDRSGFAVGLIRDGKLAGIHLEDAPSVHMWDLLTTHAAVEREFHGASAFEHIAAAEQFMDSLLRPGETQVVETAVGTMEWSWIDPPMDADFIGSSTWSQLGFFLVGYKIVETSDTITLWMSPDGVDWTPVTLPEVFDGIGQMHPWKEGILVSAWHDDSRSLLYYNGSEWIDVMGVPPEGLLQTQIELLAISGDTVMSISGWWNDESYQMEAEAVLVDPDLTRRDVILPVADLWMDAQVALVGSADGFILTESDFTDNSFTVWHSPSGNEWSVLAQSTGLENAGYLWNLQQHRSQYFIVGDSAEMVCLQDEHCYSLTGVWTSPDGVAWDRVLTESGQPMASYQIGSGPLGLFAFGQPRSDTDDPREMYLSIDGSAWMVTEGFSLFDPESEWWWIGTPVVGVDTVIASGSAFGDSAYNDETGFLLIGRLLDG